MTSKKLLLAGLIAALGMAGSVQAATVTITPSISAVLNSDFSDASSAVIPGTRTLVAKPGDFYLLQVEVQVATSDLGSAVGFSNTAFNTVVGGNGGTIYADVDLGIAAWTPDNPPVDTNGPAPGGTFPKWDINSDDGTPNDLNGVILAGVSKGFGPAQYDTRRTLTLGEGGDHGGTFYIKLPGEHGSSGFAELIGAFGASTYDAEGVSSTVGNTAVGGMTDTWSVQPIPEPSTLALLGLGSVLLVVARKRR